MKNFTQVNRALAAEKNMYLNLNQSQSGCGAVDVPMTSYGASDEHPMSIRSASDGTRWNSRGWKYVAMIFAVLVMSVGQMWSADQVLKTVDFSTSAWSSATFTENATTVVDGVTASSSSSSSKPTISISSGKFTMSGNMSSGKNCVGFQVSGIQYGTLIIEVYSDASTITRCNYTVKDGGSSFSTSDAGSGTSSTVGEPIIVTGLTKTSAYVYVGRQGSSYTQFSKIIVKTPNPTGKTYAESTFYTTYASSSKTNAQLISSASFPENFLPIFAGASALNDKPASTPTVTTPYDFSGVSTSSKSYILQTAENNVLLLNNVANVKSVRFYGDGNGSSGNISVTVTKQSGSGSTFSVSNISFTSTKTILEHSTGDLTGKSGYDANTFYNYKFTFSKKFHIWGVYVEAIVAEKDYTVTAATSTGDNTYGTVSAGASSLDATETTTITATPATGYQVTNWAVSGTGASISPSGASNANSTTLTMGTADATVTATFGPKSYTVTLDNQSATTDGTENVTTTYNSNTNLTSAITKPTKTGYVFAGYFTAANGGGVQLIDPAGNWIASAGGGSTYLDGSKNWKNDGNLTLYACWMEYANSLDLQNYVETEVGSSAGDKTTSKEFTHLTSNNYICSLSGNTELDNSDNAAYRGLKFKNSGDYILFLVPANYSLSVKWGYVKSSKPKYSINGGAAQTFTTLSTDADNSSSPGDIEISSQSYIQLVKLMTSDANATVLKEVTITASCTAPTAVYVTQTAGSSDMVAGESFTLSAATSTGVEDGATYQWYRGSTEVGTNSPIFTVASCTAADAGTYWCKITNPCSSDAHTTNTVGFGIKVWQVLLYKDSWNAYDLTSTGTKTGEVTRQLTPGTYYIKLTHNNGVDFGVNTGSTISEITATTPSAWTLYNGQNNIKVTVTTAGDYTFGVNYTSADNPTLSVTYPPSTISSCDKIYFCPTENSIAKDNAKFSIYFYNDNSETGWANCYLVDGTEFADDAKYVAYAPATTNGWKKMIVVRDDEYASSFSGIWNQSHDITYNGYNYIVGTGWSDGKFTTNPNSFYSSTTPAMDESEYCVIVGGTTTASTNLPSSAVTYTSSDETKATVGSTTGVITGVAAGTATITAKVGTCTVGTATVTVYAAPSVVLSSSSVTYGASAPTLTPSNFATITGYSSLTTGTATINGSGVISIAGAGTTTFTVTGTDQCGNSVNVTTGTFTVNKADISPSLSYTSTTLTYGGGNSSTPTISGNTGSGTVTYSVSASSPSGCATVNESTGVVTPVSAGAATITATIAATTNYNGGTATTNFTINKATPTKYDFSVDKTTLCGEETATLTLEDSEDGVTYELRSDATHSIADTQKAGTGSALAWTGLGAGNYVVYAVETANYEERQMNSSKITVTTGTATSITTQPTNQEVTVDEEATLTVVAAGTSLTYQWKESATEDGTYSNVASGGTSSSYSVTPAAAGTKWYKCVVTGTCGTETTAARKIVANAAVTYTVTYDAQGGSVTPTSEDVSTATLPTPTKTDYTFQGWYTSGGTLISGTYNPTADITLYALWREDECSGGGGGSTTLISYTITEECTGASPCDHTASGTPGGTAYLFKLKTSNDKYKLNNDPGDAIPGSYFALKLSSGYFQTGDVLTMDGSKAMQVYTGTHGSGTLLAATSGPSDGVISYTLPNTLPNNTNEIYVYRSSSTYNGTLTYMTVTRAGGGGSGTCYYVTYNGNGADGGFTKDEASHPSGSDVTVKTNSFTKTGYTFTGWHTDPDGVDGDAYGAGDEIENISGNVTLYAQWSDATEYDISTSATNGTIAVTDDEDNEITSAEESDEVTITATPSDGYEFTSWTVTDEDEGSVTVTSSTTNPTTFTMPAKAVTVSATFSEITHTVSVAAGAHGTVSPSSVSGVGIATASGDITATPATGYSFNGWTLPSGVTAAAGKTASSNPIQINATADDKTITATWTAKSYTLTLDKNHSSAAAAASTSSVNYDATSFTPTAPTYDGHSVDGYYTSANCTTLVATAAGALQASITVSETVWTNSSSEWKKDGAATFYAHWKCNTPSISCTDNVVTITVPTGSTVYYTTNGSTPTAGSLEYDPSDKPTISANTTIKAIAIQSGCTSSDVASEDCTFTGDCEETTLFSMIVKSSIDDYSLAASTTVTNSDDAVSSRLTSISGGTLSIENTTKSSSKTVFDNNCLYISSNDVYYTITLSGSKTLQAGDSITITTRTAYSPYITTSSTRAENPTMTKSGSSDPYTYTLTIANTSAATGKNLIGYGTFYLWKNSSAAQIHSITITRPCVDATHTISYDKGEGTGTMSSHASIAHNGSQVLTSNSFTAPDNYTFAGWAADVDVTVGGSTVKAGALIANEATITNITSDIALTAKWKQTITLNANTSNHGSGDNTSAVAILNGTALNSISHTTAASGYKLAGYYTAATSGTKVLNSDGSFAGDDITDYISDSKWTRTGAAPTLYAQYEASGSIKWNLVVNSDTTVLSTSTKNSSYTEISTSNMTDAAVNGVTYAHSAKSGLTGKISTPAYDADKYVKVTFQVASGYKFTPSLIQVPIQPVGDGEHKAVELRLTDESSHSLVSASATKCDGTTKGKKTTVTLAGDGSTYFTGTVTLKIYVYPHGDATAATNACYRLGTPIQIDGAVEATCTMPSYESVSYSQTEYVKDASASAISVVGASGDPSYQWKYNSTGDRTSGTNCGTEASVTPSTESTGTLYYWCELTNACGTVKTPAVAITVSASKSEAPSIVWTDPASVNYGGGGYTLRATVNDDSWDGSASDLTITAPAGICIYNTTTGTDGSSKKYIEVKFDVQTAFDRSTYEDKIPFTVSADATATYNAISADHNVSYSACSGGGGSATEELMPVDDSHMDNSTWKGGWVYDGIGMMRYGHGSSDVAPGTKNANLVELTYKMADDDVDTYYKSSANHFGFYTEKAITGVRLYVHTSNDNVTVSGVYIGKDAFTSGTPSSGAVTYEAVYNDDNEALRSGTHSGSAWVDITFDKEVAAEKYGQINLSSNVRIAGIAFISASGSGATLTTTLAFASSSVTKAQSDANFTITPTKGDYSETLGAITYSSSNTDCATVNATTGEVTITATGSSNLTSRITATLAASGCYKSATAYYDLTVTGQECTIISAGTLSADKTVKCSSANVTLTLSGEDDGMTVRWYRDATDVTASVSDHTLITSAAGSYSVVVSNATCSKRSNSITISNYSAEVAATKIVDKWYIKNGRVTPDIALWALDEGTHLSSVAWSPSNGTGLTAADDFYESDGIVYLKGKEPSSNENSDVEYTLTLMVKDECENTTELSTSDKQITLTHQKNTDKHVLAFVVTGTEKGGWTAGISADQTTGVDLYNEIAKNFDVQATNIYSTDDEQKLKEYYSQFDILCITDYPNTGKTGTNKKSYVDAIGSLIDIRPILTMEAFVSKLDNWKSKGISGTPKSPTTRQYSMLLQCKDHEIFSGTNPTTVGSGDETMYRIDMVDKTQEEYVTLDATYGAGAHAEKSGYEYGSKPALQGFTYDASMSSLLPIGRIDDGEGNDLEVGVERQAVMEARLLVLGINGYAMERLDDDGMTIVINALKYLMKKNAEDIADCSNYFVGGAEGDPYSWKNLDNWSGSTLPDRTQEVRIVAPCVISDTIARASSVKIVTGGTYSHGTKTANGSLTINPTGSLIVEGKIYAATAPNFFEKRTTEPENLIVKANESKTGTLIFDNENGDTQATIEMYSPSHWEIDPGTGKYVKYWSYVGMPIKDVHIPDYFYGAFTYYFNEAKGWEKRFDNDIMQPFEGIGLSMQEGHKETFYGTMVSTENTDITITNHTGYGDGDNLIGNSWTAPIQIANFDEDDFGTCWATVYIFNTGKGGDTYVNATIDNDGAAKAGQWLGVPIGVAGLPEYTGLKVIPAMNAFLVHDTLSTSTTLHLDYDKLVRDDATTNSQINEKMRAPSRHPRKKKDVDGLMRIRVVGETTNTDVWMLQDERFSERYDNGWEAYFSGGDNRSPVLYAQSAVGPMGIVALQDLDGTVLGFAPSRDGNDYTFTFYYRGDEEYYLNDLKLQQSVLIDGENNYNFTFEKGDTNRFYVSRTPFEAPQITTDVDNTSSSANQSTKAIKVIYNDKLYIIRGGRVYSADGTLVK